jgi:hypothetical protein
MVMGQLSQQHRGRFDAGDALLQCCDARIREGAAICRPSTANRHAEHTLDGCSALSLNSD